jgi:hypothetical protein
LIAGGEILSEPADPRFGCTLMNARIGHIGKML